MMITGNWYLRNIAQHTPSLDFGVVPAPVPTVRLRGEGRFKGQPKFITWSVGPYWAIPKGARHAKEAWRFIKWMNSAEAMLIGATALQKYHKARHEPFVFGTTSNRKT